MATTATLTGTFTLPNDAAPDSAVLSVTLSAMDTDQNTGHVLPDDGSFTVALVAGAIPAGLEIWKNTAGLRGTHYRATLAWTASDGRLLSRYLGSFQVGDDASYDMADLLDQPPIATLPEGWYSTLTQGDYDAAITARDEAVAAAAAAAEDAIETAADRAAIEAQAESYVTLTGTQTLTNKTINLASNTLVATSAQLRSAVTDETGTGALVFAGSPALTGTPTAPTAAAGTNTTQVATTEFANATAAAQAALYAGPWVQNVTALMDDTALTYSAGQPGTVAAGQIVRTRAEGFAYEVAASGATDQHLTTAGGVKLYVRPSADGRINSKAMGATGDGSTVDTTALQSSFDIDEGLNIPKGEYSFGASITSSVAKMISGMGPDTLLKTTAGFGAAPMLDVSPTSGTNPKGWTLENLTLENAGSATHAIRLDISTTFRYLSKTTIRNIISNTQVSEAFVELVNSVPHIDGYFTSVIEDCWSFGGFKMVNVGDSLTFARNTTTGAGVSYHIDQMETAANIVMRDGNSTCSGGGLHVVKGSNITFENMQVECPVTFTGSHSAVVTIRHKDALGLVFNSKIVGCNINPQPGNPSVDAIHVDRADQTIIDGNQLYCDPASGAHIYIGPDARNTIIGNNKYYNSTTGAEIDPIIDDSGKGTVGIWKDATITLAGWGPSSPSTDHPPGYFRDRDGKVLLRGGASGAATTGGDILFTLPVGMRPAGKGYLFGLNGGGVYHAVQITPTGVVQILTTGITSVYFSGVTFSVR